MGIPTTERMRSSADSSLDLVTTNSLTFGSRRHLRIQASHGWRALDLRELWRYRDLVYILALRDVQVLACADHSSAPATGCVYDPHGAWDRRVAIGSGRSVPGRALRHSISYSGVDVCNPRRLPGQHRAGAIPSTVGHKPNGGGSRG